MYCKKPEFRGENMIKSKRFMFGSRIFQILVALTFIISGFTVGIPRPKEAEQMEDPEDKPLGLYMVKVLGDDEVFTNTYCEWEVEIIVTNRNEHSFSEIIVTSVLPAQIDCLSCKTTKGTFEIIQNEKGKSGSKTISWSIDSLAGLEDVSLTLILCTIKNPADHQEFTSPGEYTLIEGALLKANDTVTGKRISQGPTPSIFVRAVNKDETPVVPEVPKKPEVLEVPEVPNVPKEPEEPKKPKATQKPPKIDVLFLIDSTGSMGDEIKVVKEKIEDIIFEVLNGTPKPDVRFAIVTYRDRGDDYITKTFDFTKDVEEIKAFLRGIKARCGGDGPESVNEALHVAINECEWGDDEHVKMILLIGDAPPHMDYKDDYDYREEVVIAKQKGIKIHVIGCSGITCYVNGVSIFLEIANKTDGTFQELIYGSRGGSSSSHGMPPICSPYPGNSTHDVEIIRSYRKVSPDIPEITIIPGDLDSEVKIELHSAPSTPTVSSGSSLTRDDGNTYSNYLDVQLTYVIQQEAIENGVSYKNVVSLTMP